MDFTLPRGSVITGRVLDEFGEPVADVQVMPIRNQFTAEGRRPMPSGRISTSNDIGEFRLFGLAPGQYYVSATVRGASFGTDTSEDRSGYAPTYYPGAPTIADAQPLTIGAGETLSDITLMLVPTRTARVSGTAVDAQGRPLKQGSVMATLESVGMMMSGAGGPIRPDGTFTVSGLAPGDYVLRAMTPALAAGIQPEIVTAKVTVNGEDVVGVRLAPMQPITVSGRLVVDPGAAASLKPEAFRFIATPKTMRPMWMGPARPGDAVHGDLTFQFQTYPGEMIVVTAGAQPGWMVKAIRLNGTDVTDGIDFKPGQNVADLEVEITDRIPEISGLVTNAKGEPVTSYAAIFFPQDEERGKAPGRGRSGMVRPDQDGRFKLRTLRPGNYYVAAVEAVENGQWMDPEYLETLRARATRISLGEGETKSIGLKLLTVP
jgi:hypothetical protein